MMAGRQVVGEHFYQAALGGICRGRTVPVTGDVGCWENSLPVSARLVAEHNNPHYRTAVRVEVRGMTVGHLPREDAAVLHEYLAAAHERRQHTQCEGRIVVASNGDYSIYLHLASLDSVVSALRPPGGEARMEDPSQADTSGQEGHRRAGITHPGPAASPQPS